MREVFLEWLQGGGIEYSLLRRSPEDPRQPSATLPVPVDRPGERLALRIRDASLQVQVSDDVRDNRLHEHGLASFRG